MNETSKAVFKIGKKYVRGDRKGKVYTKTITLDTPEAIHGFLWDLTDAYDAEKCDYIVEWYSKIK